MIDTEGDAAEPSSKNKETDKKKRSRVKQLLGDVKRQVDFWFGDVNLHKDRFLKKIIDESDDGYVDLSMLASFNRMKKLTNDTKLIARALKDSSVVEINLEGDKIRRLFPIGDIPNDVDERTVYVELLPKDVSHSWIERVFTKCGNVVYVSIPRYKTSNDPKGFAFVEFETGEQAQKAIEMLNNPPEDAPRKPGIFPKTKSGKPFPLPVDNPPSGEEDEKKKRKKKRKKEGATVQTLAEESREQDREAEPSELKRRRMEAGDFKSDVAATPKTLEKLPERKRRRSQTAEGPEGDVPSKMRRTSESETGEKEKDLIKPNTPTKSDTEGGIEEGKENRDDAAVKAKRKRKKKHKEKLKIGEEVIPLRVLSKKVWLELKEEYLTLQKCSMKSLKKCIYKIDHKEHKSLMETNNDPQDGNVVKSEKSEKETNLGPQFTSGVIMKITDNKPLPGRKFIKDALSKIAPVAYIDTLDGDVEGYIRFHTVEDAKVVSEARAELQKEHSWKVEILAEARRRSRDRKILRGGGGGAASRLREEREAVRKHVIEVIVVKSTHSMSTRSPPVEKRTRVTELVFIIDDGDHEQRYWQKILVDRQVKLNRPREKKRGTEKLISKAEKIILARAKEAHKHIRFQED